MRMDFGNLLLLEHRLASPSDGRWGSQRQKPGLDANEAFFFACLDNLWVTINRRRNFKNLVSAMKINAQLDVANRPHEANQDRLRDRHTERKTDRHIDRHIDRQTST